VIRVRQFGQALGESGGDAGSSSGPTFRARFECIPADTPWRAPRLTPAPRIDGLQTATVTGPGSGDEEIHTDEHGRIKVQFHWDRLGKRDDHSSCWIRVSQAWGGAGYGSMIIPRVGHEVIVEFLEGDPDRPIVTGRVYNGVNVPAHGLPGKKAMTVLRTATTPGGGGYNELRLDDSAGSQLFHLHAQKDMNIKIQNNKTEHVGVDETQTIGANLTHTVGANDMLSIGQNSKLEVKGNEEIKIGGTDLLVVTGSEGIGIGGDYTLDVGGALAEVVGGAKATAVRARRRRPWRRIAAVVGGGSST
jgi:type VI secretion system secreted protein VgrG